MDEDELYLKEILLSKSIEQVEQTNQILFRWLSFIYGVLKSIYIKILFSVFTTTIISDLKKGFHFLTPVFWLLYIVKN